MHTIAVWHTVKDGVQDQRNTPWRCHFHLILHVLTFWHESAVLRSVWFDHEKVKTKRQIKQSFLVHSNVALTGFVLITTALLDLPSSSVCTLALMCSSESANRGRILKQLKGKNCQGLFHADWLTSDVDGSCQSHADTEASSQGVLC